MPPKAKKERKPRAPKQKPAYLPTLEPPMIQEIEDAATAYQEAKLDRQEMSEVEKNTKKSLIERMVANQLTRYETHDEPALIVDLLSTSNVAVKKKKEARTEGDDS